MLDAGRHFPRLIVSDGGPTALALLRWAWVSTCRQNPGVTGHRSRRGGSVVRTDEPPQEVPLGPLRLASPGSCLPADPRGENEAALPIWSQEWRVEGFPIPGPLSSAARPPHVTRAPTGLDRSLDAVCPPRAPLSGINPLGRGPVAPRTRRIGSALPPSARREHPRKHVRRRPLSRIVASIAGNW
jgi:hypothetical protein